VFRLPAVPRPAVIGRRWIHLLLGGALLMPYFLLAEVVTEAVTTAEIRSLSVQLLMFAATLPVVGLTALAGPVRLLQGITGRELLGTTVLPAPARSARDRLRTSAWCVAHLGVGGVVSALSLTLPPAALLLSTLPFREHHVGSMVLPTGWSAAWAPVAAVAILASLVGLVVAAGALLTRLAEALLGPSAADRLAGLQRLVDEQATRNRLARDLHDSLGHELSIISIQAGAGERRLASDPAFARAAFSAIQQAAYTASEELDRAIGLLSARPVPPDEPPARLDTRRPGLDDLDRLLRALRDAGVEVDSDLGAGLRQLPAAVSHEAYRVVQEGLTNAVRHAGRAAVRLRVWVDAGGLQVQLTNRMDEAPSAPGPRAGHGLRGMAQRVAALGGELTAGPVDDEWRVRVCVPLATAP
jgi:signal transduction histidine kinase